LVGGWGPGAQALFVWTPQRPDREQMWEGRRPGSQPEQLGEIKNNSIPRDMGNYTGQIKQLSIIPRWEQTDITHMYTYSKAISSQAAKVITPPSSSLHCRKIWFQQLHRHSDIDIKTGVWQRTVKLLVAGRHSAESQATVTDSSRSSCTCSRVQKVGTMPDSPADVKTQPRSTPPTMPPPPPAVSQASNRNASFTPATSKSMLNGSSHSPTSLNGAPSTPNGFSNGPAMSSTASLSNQQLPPACGARQLCKLKRFLTTLQQFGNDISPEIGERVRSLVLGLVNSTLTIEEFHSKLHEATNFPLRPFVIPFLKRELLHCARLAKQTPAQYLAQHEQLLLDANASSPLDSSEIMLELNEHGKRRTPDRTKEGSERDGMHPEHHAKRPCTISPSQRFSPSTGLPAHPPPNGLPNHPPNGLPHPPNPQMGPQHYRLEDMALAHQYRDAYRHNEHRDTRDRHRPTAVHGARQEEVIDHRLTDREWAEEWKHLDNLLNCIMDMVEKTRRSLTVLRRCQEADREEMNHWIRRYSDVEEMKKEIHRDFLHRPPSGYLPEEIWRKAGTASIPLSPALKHLQNRQGE
ncbi:hypothetical protein KUCAC02_001757, partial [Chaenocephalus aceratus]